jgi:hypothetical protein
MKSHLSALAAAWFAVFATPAAAVEHEIQVLRESYFPRTTYLGQGDSIKFVNNTGYWVRVRKNNGGDLTPWIQHNSSYTMSVNSFLYLNSDYTRFKRAFFYSGNYLDEIIEGNYDEVFSYISFSPAPNGN